MLRKLAPLTLLALATGPLGAQTNLWRMNCGGPAEPAPSGPPFTADVAYSSGTGAGYEGGSVAYAMYMGGTWNGYAQVHKTARRGWAAYRFDVPNGDYIVRLHLAEADFHGALQRIFDLRAEGVTILDDLDLAARYGTRYGSLFATVVTVSDGRLDLTVGAGSSPAILNGVEVWTAPASAPAPPAVTGVAARPGYHQNIITWNQIDDPTIVGYRLLAYDWRRNHLARVDGLGHSPPSSGPRPGQRTIDLWALPPRHLDDGASLDHPEHYQVAAVDYLGRVGPFVSAGKARAMRSSDSELEVYEIQLDPQDWKHLNETFLSSPKSTVPGSLLYRGQSFPCEVRYRGQTSLVLPKKSWKLKFADRELFQGRRQINFKAHWADETMIRQELGMRFFRDLQGTTPRSSYIHLRVNGVYMGVFQMLEKINSDYLRMRDRDDDGNVYSAQTNGSVELGPWNLTQIMKEFDKETNESGPWDDLVTFVDLINQTPAADFPNEIARHLDLDGYLSYIATNGFLVDFEAIVRNYYLHHDFELERWEVIPWDNDASFSYPYIQINFGTVGSWVGNNVLKTRVLDVPAFRWRYVEKLREILAGPTTLGPTGELTLLTQSVHSSILTDARADVHKRGWEDDAPFLSGPSFVQNTAAIRRGELFKELDSYQPTNPPTYVWINEIMAYNLSTLADSGGDFDDWIELYNASASSVDISGMYLTDDLSVPTKWRIPAGPLLPPGGHALFWADEEPAEGADHANFRLRREGEQVALFDEDGQTLLDVKHFNAQQADVSLGRESDGSSFFRAMATPTPGAANTLAGNLAPRITGVRAEPSAATSSESVRIGCQASDADGIGAVELLWAPSGQPFRRTTMAHGGNDWYEAAVPPHASGTVIEYYVLASDGRGKSASAPAEAPVSTFAYGVADPQTVTLLIDEFLASNQSGIADEAGEREDWIEIVNHGSSSVDLSGMYLSDDLEDTTKWAFPLGTVLGPGEHLLVWADGEPHQGPLHANFSLSSTQGEDVALFNALGAGNSPIDVLSFGPLSPDVSIGRLPDAGPELFRILDPTPGAPNVPPTGFVRYDAIQVGRNTLGLSTAGAPAIGSSATFFVGVGPPGASGVLASGLDTANVSLSSGGVQLVLPDPSAWVSFSLDAGGTATVLVPIPSAPGLVGLSGFFQAYIGASGPSTTGVAATFTN